jgi:hypothetical protein
MFGDRILLTDEICMKATLACEKEVLSVGPNEQLESVLTVQLTYPHAARMAEVAVLVYADAPTFGRAAS